MRAALPTAVLFAAALLATPRPAVMAATITVDVAGSGDFLTIQEGLDAASSGDTVLVLPGTYGGPDNSDLSFGGNDIVLRAHYGPECTFIDHYGQFNSVFHVHEGETRAAVIDGFTVADDSAYSKGPGFYIHNASPTIQNCRFMNNYAWGVNHTEGAFGAGFFAASQGALINCVIENNHAQSCCGGVGVIDSSVDIEGCVFRDNHDEWEGIGAILISDAWIMTIRGCLFVNNHGSESCIYSTGSSYRVTVENCTFVDNGGSCYDPAPAGGLIGSYGSFPLFIENCIFAFNRVDGVMADPDGVSISWCCVYGNSCGDTLTGDYDQSEILWENPRFCNMDADDYALCSNSQCLPYHGFCDELVGAYNVGCGDCDTAVRELSWGRIKALYK